MKKMIYLFINYRLMSEFPSHRNLNERPASFKTLFAECLDLILPSTEKVFPLTGLCQMSWSPLPCRTK